MTRHVETPDLLVIGAGAGGLSVAAGAAQLGASVVLLEARRMGGDCLNWGCVPSKALIAAARHAHCQGAGAPFGVKPVAPTVDFGAVRQHIRETIATIAPHDSQERFESMGVRVIRAAGHFVDPRHVAAGGHVFRPRRTVIATGSSPFVPPIEGLSDVPYLTNETVFDLDTCPAHLLVVGGGPIGLELAGAYRRLGARVTVIEADRALGREDPELAAVVTERMRGEGVEIVEGRTVTRVTGEGGAISATLSDGRTIAGSHILVAVGRRPNVGKLGLDAAGIEAGPAGIRVDRGLRTTNRRVFALGDVVGGPQFTHVAGYHAGIVVRRAVLGLPARVRDDHIPRVTFTDPEIAAVGLDEVAARARFGPKVDVIRVPFSDIDRAVAERETDGFLKLMVHRGRPVGVGIVGPHAGELIAPWALAISAGLRLSQIAGMIAPYPTLGDIGKRAVSAHFAPRLFENRWVRRMVRMVQRF
ncbi:MAG: FAD-binding protein [Alphaproteobacteria bacterium]|nr:MAG: FAD-binding protein [Alphaproteobacteria bacterium]